MSYLPGTQEKATAPQPETFALPGSSFLQTATYDAANYSLTLDFKNGSQIIHRFFFPMSWQQFKEQSSHGSYYARNIKGKYPSINFKNPLKVSDLNRAIKEHRHHATN